MPGSDPVRAATDMFLAHLLRPTTHYRPDVEALRAAPARIVVAAGAGPSVPVMGEAQRTSGPPCLNGTLYWL